MSASHRSQAISGRAAATVVRRVAEKSLVTAGNLASLVGAPPGPRALDLVEAALVAGRVLAFQREKRRVVIELDPPSTPLGPETSPASWIEIELLDQDGMPIADEPVKVEDPAGRVRTSTTSSSGKCVIEGIDPGTCKVSFPRLDAKDWSKA